MTEDLFALLDARMDSFTQAERSVANFLLANRASLPFETAASLAEKVGVSGVTVGRFCRALGFEHFKALKDALKIQTLGGPWLTGDALSAYLATSDKGQALKRSLDLEVSGLVEVYQLSETPLWADCVTLLATAGSVDIVGFQADRGAAMSLAHDLQYVRPGVRLPDATSGSWTDILLDAPAARCLVIFDTRRYSSQSYRLAEAAAERGVPLIMITDRFCDWARRFTANVLMAPSEVGLFWSSPVATSCLSNLLVNAVVARLGPAVETRLQHVSELYDQQTGFVKNAARPKT